MPAPVVSLVPSGPSPATNPLGAAAAGGLGSIIANGNLMFANLLALGSAQPVPTMPDQQLTMAPSTALQTAAEATATSAVKGAQFQTSLMLQNGMSLDPDLLVFSEDGSPMASEDLKALLANLGDTDNELNSKLLVAMTPGTPAKDVLASIKEKLSALGVDTSKFAAVVVKTATPHLSDDTTSASTDGIPLNPLAMATTDADGAQNFLLIATGLKPSDMGPVKDAIQAAVSDVSDADVITDVTKDMTKDANPDAAAMILVVYVMPQPKPVEVAPAAPQDMSFDLSSLSALTQPATDGIEEPDWGRKLSDKLSNMTIPTADGGEDVSPFDDEMNAILSPASPSLTDLTKKDDTGFKGSLSLTKAAEEAKSAGAIKAAKVAAGEMTTQAAQTSAHLALPADVAPTGDPSLFYSNNGMMGAHQTAANITNPILTSASATSAHPSIHAVASLIDKAASGSEKAKQELTVELDPPELGRMQIQLSMEKDGPMKVHLLAEKQDTLALFQRDSHALKSALDQAGIQIDNSSLTFDLAGGDQSFNQLMGGQDQQSGAKTSHMSIGMDGSINDMNNMSVLESKMDFRTDNITGNVHYSFLA